MALSYRKRGAVWHCRGTVRVGRQTFTVREFSTGASLKAEAEAVGAAEEARIRAEYLSTGNVPEPSKTVTIRECLAIYKARPGSLHPFDVRRLDLLEAYMGDDPVSDVRAAWGRWLRESGKSKAPSTVARWRSTLMAALSHAGAELGITVPILTAIRGAEVERIAYLTESEEQRLLAAYNPRVVPIMLVLCETGMRTAEALNLDWRHVDWVRGAIMIEHSGRDGGPRTKSGRSRRVGMRPTVRQALEALWIDRGRPDHGRIFLNRTGRPYAEHRLIGGNPLSKAHQAACRKAGITGFRIHDWRHHFSIWFLKRGGNLRALCQIAGWSSIRMVSRYAVFEQSDLDDLMNKTGKDVAA